LFCCVRGHCDSSHNLFDVCGVTVHFVDSSTCTDHSGGAIGMGWGEGARLQNMSLIPTVKHTGQESGGELCETFKLWSFPQSKSLNNVCKPVQLLGSKPPPQRKFLALPFAHISLFPNCNNPRMYRNPRRRIGAEVSAALSLARFIGLSNPASTMSALRRRILSVKR